MDTKTAPETATEATKTTSIQTIENDTLVTATGGHCFPAGYAPVAYGGYARPYAYAPAYGYAPAYAPAYTPYAYARPVVYAPTYGGWWR